MIRRSRCAWLLVVLALLPPPAAAQALSPEGANDWSCRPTLAHPRPVVLVHGTFGNMLNAWRVLAPTLAANGYCVFALNYGGNQFSEGAIYGLGPIEASAIELAQFVNQVLAATGTRKVDIVGHSQGGMMPRYYLRHLAGAERVHRLIGLAPSNHGLDLDALLAQPDRPPVSKAFIGMLQQVDDNVAKQLCPACLQQVVGSTFMAGLNADEETVRGVRYTVIATIRDEVVVPYTSQFLSGRRVDNITVQDECAIDVANHGLLPYDPVVVNLVLRALKLADGVRPGRFCG